MQVMKQPTLEQIEEAFVAGRSTKKEAQKFYHYYCSNGWHVGKQKMRSWNHAVSGWILRNEDKQQVKLIIPNIKDDEKERSETREGYKRLQAENEFRKQNKLDTPTQEKIKAMLGVGMSAFQISKQLHCRRELVFSIASKLAKK